MRVLPLIIVCLISLGACSSTDEPGETAENLVRSTSGSARSDAETGDNNIPVAGSYMGDAKNENVHASATRTTANSTAGHIQKAFDFAGTIEAASEAVKARVEADIVLAALRDELARLTATDVDPAARQVIIDRMEARVREIEASVRAAGGDLSSLSHLTIVNTMNHSGNSGHTQDPLTDEEARQAATGLPSLVGAAKGR